MTWDRLHTVLALGMAVLIAALVEAHVWLDRERDRTAEQAVEINGLEADLRRARHALRAARRQHVDAEQRVRDVRAAGRRATQRLADRLDAVRSRRTRVTDHLVHRFDLDTGRAAVLAGHLVDAAARARRRYGVDVDATLLAALIRTESSFDAEARSGAGALGLTQVMPMHVSRYAFLDTAADLLNPRLNVRAGAFVLAEALQRYGNTRDALRAYHGGSAAVDDPGPATQAYVDVVTRRWAELS